MYYDITNQNGYLLKNIKIKHFFKLFFYEFDNSFLITFMIATYNCYMSYKIIICRMR